MANISELVLDTPRGMSKIMEMFPRYHALFLPDPSLSWIRGLDIVNSPRRSNYGHTQFITGSRTI